LTGGEAGSEEFGPAVVRTCKGIGDHGGYPDDLGPIRLAGRKREVWQSFPASQRSSGRLLAAAGGDGHGGVLGVCEFVHGREGE
jgi:hypothetical protein